MPGDFWDDDVTPLQESILEQLDAAGVPAHISDKILDLIAEGENERGYHAACEAATWRRQWRLEQLEEGRRLDRENP